LSNSFGGATSQPDDFPMPRFPPPRSTYGMPRRRGGVPRAAMDGDLRVHAAARQGAGGPDPFLIARSLDDPWQMKSARTPRSERHRTPRSPAVLHPPKRALRKHGAHLRHERLADLLFEELAKSRRHPLHRLDTPRSDEPVADEYIGLPGEEVPPSTFPTEN